MKEKRENLGSRIGFLLISAGCAIGLGNVWRFPFITLKVGKYDHINAEDAFGALATTYSFPV